MTYVDHTQWGDHEAGYRELYQSALEAAQQAPERTFAVEVGVREGGSALTLLDALKDADKNQWLATIDPHGDKPYLTRDSVVKGMYGDNLYRTAMKELANYAEGYKLNWAHYKMRSLDWIESWPNIEFWADGEVLEPKFFFVHLDGDHTDRVVQAEIEAFWPYLLDGGVICVDDADQVTADIICGAHPYHIADNRIWLTKAEIPS